jgi:hypothetical protein
MSSPPPWIAAAYGAERGRALGEAAERVAEALQAHAALDLARALEPGAWGRVREAMEVLRSNPRSGLPALPSLAAWLTLAPRKKGVLRFLLTGWEEHALSEGWSTAGALQEALHGWSEALPPGPELSASRLIIELLEEPSPQRPCPPLQPNPPPRSTAAWSPSSAAPAPACPRSAPR